MSGKRKFLKASSGYFTSLIAVLGVSLVSFSIVVRLLSVEKYGVLSLCNTILLFSVALSKLGFQHLLIRFYPEYKKQDRLLCFFRSYVVVGLVFFGGAGLFSRVYVPSGICSHSGWSVASAVYQLHY